MDTSPAAVTAPTTPTAVTPAAAPAAPSSLPVKDPIIEKAQKVTTPAEIRALTREFLAQPPPPAPVAPTAEVPPAAPPVETTPAEPAPEVAPVAAEVPPGTEAAVAPTDPAAPAAPADDTTPAAPGPVEVPDANNLRIRPPADDKLGRLTAAFMQKDRGLTMAQAMAKAQAQLGITPETAPAPAAPANPAKAALPQTVAEVDTSIAALEQERLTKLTGLDFEAVAKIDSSLRVLERQRVDIQNNAREQQVQAAADYNRKFTDSEAKAAELYEFASNPESAGAKRMQEIDAAMKETNDPLYGAADKPLRIAQMVAAELNIAPRRKGAPTAPVKPAAPAAPAPKKQVLPGGSTAPAAPQPPPIDAKIAQVNSVHGLRQVYKELGIPNV